jgi:SAM-dependent methyltransferase
MSHKEQMHFVWEIWKKFPEFFQNTKVLEIGSLIIEKPAISRNIFTNCEYIGIDINPGPGVDVVTLGHLYDAPDETFDMVMSCECFEHDMYYEKTISNMIRLLKPGGLMFFTCATTGRPEHGTKNSTPQDSPFTSQIKEWDNYYKNLTETDIRNISYFSKNMHGHYFASFEASNDLYYYGWKNHK